MGLSQALMQVASPRQNDTQVAADMAGVGVAAGGVIWLMGVVGLLQAAIHVAFP